MFRGVRAQFVTDRDPPALRLHGVAGADQALYRCRVDFRSSPTRNQRVNLTVISEWGWQSVSRDCHLESLACRHP